AFVGNTGWKAGYCIEAIGGSQEPMADIGRDEPTDACGKGRRQDEFRRAGDISAVSTGIQDRRRPVYAAAERELIIHRVGGLAVNFPEAQVGFDDVAVDRQAERDRISICRAVARNEAIEAGATRVPIIPIAEIERELAEGWPDAAVEVDL